MAQPQAGDESAGGTALTSRAQATNRFLEQLLWGTGSAVTQGFSVSSERGLGSSRV